MLDKISDFVSKNKVTSAVIAGVAVLALFAASDKGGGAGGGGGGFAPVAGGGGGGGHEVIDQNGFAQPVRALTIPLPPGWTAQSNIRWNNVNGQCTNGIASPYIRMTSRDQREQIEFLPGYLVTTDSSMITNRGVQPGDFCIVGMAPSGEALIRNLAVPHLRQGARIDRIVAIPLTPEQQQAAQQFQQLAQSSGSNMRSEVYSLEAWLTHPDGTTEILAASGYVFAYPQLIQGVPPLVFNSNDGLISVRGAPDRVQGLMQTARTLVQQVQWNPEWKSQIEETQRQVTQPVSSRGRGGGGGGGGGGFDMDRWREEQRRDDEAQRRRIEAIREVERCYDPETGRTYEVSIHVGC